MLNETFQSHPIKMGGCNTNKNSLIVTTISPIWRIHPVHPGTKPVTIFSLKTKENIIFTHNYILERNKNQASDCFDFHCCIFSFVKGLDTSNQLQSILTLIV